MSDPAQEKMRFEQQLRASIKKALVDYRIYYQNSLIPDRDFMLVDALTPSWENNIEIGEKEIDNLADHIYDSLDIDLPCVQAASQQPVGEIELLRNQVRECRWSYDEDTDSWDGECGAKWVFEADGPVENDCNFCPECGGSIALPPVTVEA